MPEEQKSELNELLEALKKGTNNSIEILYDGTVAGFQVVKYDKGDDYIWYSRNFEWFSHTRNVDLTNKELCDLINYSIENGEMVKSDTPLSFDLLNKLIVEGTVTEFLNTDSYEYNNYDLDTYSMDDDEIPEEILDEDEEIDVLKLEENGWSFEIMETEEEFDESEITEISISVDDKQFTFKSD